MKFTNGKVIKEKPDTVCLITAPVSTDFEDPEDAASGQVRAAVREPKLGILALAAVLHQAGARPAVFDLDSAYAEYLAEKPKAGLEFFPAWAAGRIVVRGGPLFGFSTICSSYPLTLRIAEAVKRLFPGCTILLGGPQASVVDTATLAAFPFVDFILRGEADLSLPLFLHEWRGNRHFASVPGLTFRSPFGPQRNPDAPVVDNIDDLPLPAYYLTDDLQGAEQASLELGRGCPFSCTFCSTNDFFRRKFRVKSPQRMLADMRAIAAAWGIRKFNLVHDMFTVDRRRVAAFCEAMIDSGEGFVWACSARTDCVDEELLELMGRAGCRGIFFGVESGSARMQAVIDKDLDPAQSKRMISTADRFEIPTTVALIAGFPEETADDLRQTIDMYMYSLRHLNSAPQISILAPLAGTPVYSKYRDQMVLEELCSDSSHQGRMQNAADRNLIQSFPHIFPNFYLLPTPGLERASVLELREFLLMASERVRWLLVALHQCIGALTGFELWRRRREVLYPGLSGWEMRHYYMQETSRNEFVKFADSHFANSPDDAVRALVSYHKALIEADKVAVNIPESEPGSGRILRESIPVRQPGLRILELDWDIQGVIDSLKNAEPAVAASGRKYYRTEQSPQGQRSLIEITQLTASALKLCDGRRTVKEFSDYMAPALEWAPGLEQYAAKCLLENLRDEKLISIHGPARGVSRVHTSNRAAGSSRRQRSRQALAAADSASVGSIA